MRPEGPALFLVAALAAAPALAWEEPARGTPLRAALMDTLRPHAVAELGPPVEFVVRYLRVAQDMAFASVWAQRPGGAPIDMARTPIVAEGRHDPEFSDGPSLQALLQRRGGGWVVVRHEVGATEAWWADPTYCADWRPVIADVCP